MITCLWQPLQNRPHAHARWNDAPTRPPGPHRPLRQWRILAIFHRGWHQRSAIQCVDTSDSLVTVAAQICLRRSSRACVCLGNGRSRRRSHFRRPEAYPALGRDCVRRGRQCRYRVSCEEELVLAWSVNKGRSEDSRSECWDRPQGVGSGAKRIRRACQRWGGEQED